MEGEHAVILGMTGFGKSYLVKRLERERTFVVVHDPKGTWNVPGYKRFTKLAHMMRVDPEKYPRIVYTPTREELRDWSVINRFFEWVYLRGRTTLILDEVTSVVNGQDMADAFKDLLARGRELGHEVWSLSQQAVYVPNLVFTQSKNIYTFYNAHDEHRAKIAGFMPFGVPKVEAKKKIELLQKKEFYYYREGMRGAIGPCQLVEHGERVIAA